MRTRAVNSTEDAGDIVRGVANVLPEEVSATLPNNRALKKVVHRARQAGGNRVPRAPETINGWEIPNCIRTLPNQTNFLQWDSGIDDPERIIILATDAMINR